MNHDDIIRMAREAHLDVYGLGKNYKAFASALERFFNLAVVAEREACAKVCDAVQQQNEDDGAWLWEAKNCAIAIRARGREMIKTWQQRCEEHPDHNGIVSEGMIQARMQEEIDELRAALKQTQPERPPIQESALTHNHLWIGELWGRGKNP